MKSVLTPLAKYIELTTPESETDTTFQKKIFGSWLTTLITSNEEIEHTMKIIKSIEDSDLLIKSVVTKTDKIEIRKKRCEHFGMLLGALVAGLLENMLAVKGIIKTGEGINRQGQEIWSHHILWLILKSCVRCICASLFFKSKRKYFQTRKNIFYFTPKALFVLEKIKF